jgi:3-oxoacyl-[acyl-carrier protein] reductase
MSDRYLQFVENPIGRQVAGTIGLPRPVGLRRAADRGVGVEGPVLVGAAPGGALAAPVTALLKGDGVGVAADGAEERDARALVFDATGIADSTELVALQAFFTPALARLRSGGRAVVLGLQPGTCPTSRAATAQRALEGFVRALAKEIGGGRTANLVLVPAATDLRDGLASTVRFLLSPRSAFVSGQVVRVGPADAPAAGAPRVALVTGAARGIGAAIAATLARDGAHVIGLDVPSAEDDLRAAMDAIGGSALALDITAEDTPAAIVDHVADAHGTLDVVVHNAGITRDRRLARMDAERFGLVVDVNLSSQERLNDALLDGDVLGDAARFVCVSSISGIAGNAGQTNYATSKAGVIGMVDALAPTLAERGATINAVAPGFIETEMTASVPFAIREAGRRMSSLGQGGLPVDVAEAIAWFAAAESGGVQGNVVRVCGQSLLGA